MKFCVIILILAGIAEGSVCKKLREGGDMVSTIGCVVPDPVDSEVLYARNCDGDSVCCTNTSTNVGFCVPYVPHSKFPGEYCDRMDECVNDVCGVNHRCFGLHENENCSSHAECNYNYSCQIPEGSKTGKCVPVPTLDEKCVGGMCDPPYICNNGTCVKIGSKGPGDPASSWFACKTLYAHNGTCTSIYELSVDDPDEGVCEYKYSLNGIDHVFRESPVCGNNSKLYCNKPRHTINVTHVILIC